jgi:hypothetical protein
LSDRCLGCNAGHSLAQDTSFVSTAEGYDDWKQGALAGIAYALATCVDHPCQVTVTKIEGLPADSNPTIVGGAAVQALWSAVHYTPSREQLEHVDQLVFQSFSHPVDYLPEFHI